MPRKRRFTRLAANMRYLRLQQDFSQHFVGDLIGVSRFAVSKYEAGDRRPDTDSLRKLAHLYNVTIDDLLNEDMTGVFTKEKTDETA